MLQIRTHPWLNIGYNEPPTRIYPRVSGEMNEVNLSFNISSIYREGCYTVITIHKPGREDLEITNKLGDPSRLLNQLSRSDDPAITVKTRNRHQSASPDLLFRHVTKMQGRKRNKSVHPPTLDTNLSPDFKFLHRMTQASPVSTISSIGEMEQKSPVEIEPTLEEITNWHRMHRPAKTVRHMPISFRHGATSSVLDAPTMFLHLHEALVKLKSNSSYPLTFEREGDLYLFKCADTHEGGILILTLEICKIWLLSQFSLKTERVSGSALAYQNFTNNLLSSLKWHDST